MDLNIFFALLPSMDVLKPLKKKNRNENNNNNNNKALCALEVLTAITTTKNYIKYNNTE